MSERIPIFQGQAIDLGIEPVTLPNGKEVELEIIRHPGASAVLPLHQDGTVTLVYQFRHAGGGMHYEVPAGKLDGPELPEKCARRELAEETGLRCEKLQRLGFVHTTPSFTDELIFLFLATGLEQGESALEDDEYLKPVRMPFAQALEMVHEGDITDAKTMLALMLAEKHVAVEHGGRKSGA